MGVSLLPVEEAELLGRIEQLLAAPEHAGNALRAPLAQLFAYSAGQRERLLRLIRISDGYQTATRDHELSLEKRYDRQLQRLAKLARISDRYQNSLREMSQALKEASLRDTLTGAGNRRFLIERFGDETERANRNGKPYAVAILDVDLFKAVNDRYGHEAGDRVLCAIVDCVHAALREYDVCGRWGGEEFLIILPETSLEAAVQAAERIRCRVAEVAFDFLEGGITASLGVTTYALGEAYASTINRADKALLAAKGAGRNRVEKLPATEALRE